MDVYVLVDAIAKCVSSEEKELCRIAELALTFMVETAATIVGDRDKVWNVHVEHACVCCIISMFHSRLASCHCLR